MAKNKRFTSDIHRIYDNNEEIACADTMDDAEILVDRLNEQEERIRELEKEKESWKNSVCHDMNLKSMLSFEISKLTETKDIEKFLDFYYKYFCKINGDDNDGKS